MQPLNVSPQAAAVDLSERTDQGERLRCLLDDLTDLPERHRGALPMRELAGLSFEEIGEAFATSSAEASQAVFEARLTLARTQRRDH